MLKGDAAMDAAAAKMNLARMEDIPREAAAGFEQADIVRFEGTIYIRSGNRVLCCEAGEAGEALVQALEARGREPANSGRKNDPWRDVLKGEIRVPGAAGGIRDGIRRCVILFETMPGQEKPFTRALWDDLAPVERGDAVTETETGDIVLIRQAEGHTEEETAEFAAAVIETVETETGIQIQAGIGAPVQELAGMKDSLRQARQAIAMGRVFQPEGRVFAYNRQAMERLISAIPAETRAQLRKELLSEETGKQLNSEMMETVRAFFRNDLNLSTTARQLFIHRNTLIYRLDKIRKETGFDLRCFRDAAVFQMISCIPEENRDN